MTGTSALLPLLLSGVALGGIYASLALALVAIYRATRHVNFAQGAMATACTFLADAALRAGAPYALAAAGAVLFAIPFGMAVERLLIRPFADAPAPVSVGVSIGLLLMLDAGSGAIWGYAPRSFPSPFGGGVLFGGVLSRHEAGSLLTVAAIALVLWLFFRFTRLGLAMRAAAFDPVGSGLVGIDVRWMAAFGWGLAAALGAVAGLLIAPIVFLEPGMLSGALLYAFAGALLGGLDSPAAAALGAVLVGVIESLGGAYLIGTELKLPLALLLIALVLTVRPTGLFGRGEAARA